MHIRPRCREWIPLATQQLRLRNLSAISGMNIECDLNSKLYYTLHYTAASDAFYTSEMVHCYDINQQTQWAEITSSEMLKSNSTCVCVRVWEHSVPCAKILPNAVQLNIDAVKSISPNKYPDKLLFTWGVYFSGLVMINHQVAHAKCIANSLIFQINGEYFTSPEHFTTSTLREQLSISYQQYSKSVPTQRALFNESGNSGDEFFINSPKVSRSSSPITTNGTNYNENADLMRINRDLLRMSKVRYMELQYFCSEVRKSYNLKKLLNIQEMQRQCIKKSKETKNTADDITAESIQCYTASAGNIPRQRISKSRYTSSMGRTLSVLLSQQNIMEPEDMAKAQILQKENETLQFKLGLLQQEHDRYTTRIDSLRKKLTKHHEARLKLQSFLTSRYRNLNRDEKLLAKKIETVIEKIRTKKHTNRNVERRMSSLCRELKEIYPISRNKNGFFTINNIPFPNMDSYINDAKYASSCSLENVSPMTLSASLGYVAHLTQMIALILNRPLRNPINHEGSRTRILDTVKDIPYTSREFPLYTRSTIPSKPVKYAIYLLNQNIAQLSFEITGIRCDLRATIENILLIFDSFNENNENQKDFLKPLQISYRKDDKHIDGLSKSRSSIDLNSIPVPQIQNNSKTIILTEKRTSLRVCRSVGSYSDCEDDFRDIVENTYSNSDTNLAFQNDHI